MQRFPPRVSKVLQLVLVALLGASVSWVARAFPGDPPDTWHRKVAHEGFLEASGQPVNGNRDLTFSLFVGSGAATSTWSETLTAVPIAGGRYSVVLGDNAANPIPAAVFTRNSVYLEVAVDGTALAGRQRMVGAPFASLAADPVPPGTVIMFDGSTCPDGYVELTQARGRFPRGIATGDAPLSTGGAPTHVHGTPAHTHSLAHYTSPHACSNGDWKITDCNGGRLGVNSGGGSAQGVLSYTDNGGAGTSDSVDHTPQFLGLLFCRKQ